MERLSAHVSLLSVFAVGFLGLVSVAFYRLFFHPLARFPGPKLAALTRYYEGYWDLYHNGQYTFKIAELHKRYGEITPCVRPFQRGHTNEHQVPSSGLVRTSYTSAIRLFLMLYIDKMRTMTSTGGLPRRLDRMGLLLPPQTTMSIRPDDSP